MVLEKCSRRNILDTVTTKSNHSLASVAIDSEKSTKTRRATLMRKYKVLIVSPEGDVLIDRDYDTFTFCGAPIS